MLHLKELLICDLIPWDFFKNKLLAIANLRRQQSQSPNQRSTAERLCKKGIQKFLQNSQKNVQNPHIHISTWRVLSWRTQISPTAYLAYLAPRTQQLKKSDTLWIAHPSFEKQLFRKLQKTPRMWHSLFLKNNVGQMHVLTIINFKYCISLDRSRSHIHTLSSSHLHLQKYCTSKCHPSLKV